MPLFLFFFLFCLIGPSCYAMDIDLNNLPEPEPPAPPSIPHAEQATGDLDLALQLAPPGGGGRPNIDWNSLQELLSPDFPPYPFPLPQLPTPVEAIQDRIRLENLGLPENVQRPLAEAEELVRLKGQIIDTMSELNESKLLIPNKEVLLRHSILQSDRLTEFHVPVLTQRMQELQELKHNSFLYSELLKIRSEYEKFFRRR